MDRYDENRFIVKLKDKSTVFKFSGNFDNNDDMYNIIENIYCLNGKHEYVHDFMLCFMNFGHNNICLKSMFKLVGYTNYEIMTYKYFLCKKKYVYSIDEYERGCVSFTNNGRDCDIIFDNDELILLTPKLIELKELGTQYVCDFMSYDKTKQKITITKDNNGILTTNKHLHNLLEKKYDYKYIDIENIGIIVFINQPSSKMNEKIDEIIEEMDEIRDNLVNIENMTLKDLLNKTHESYKNKIEELELMKKESVDKLNELLVLLEKQKEQKEYKLKIENKLEEINKKMLDISIEEISNYIVYVNKLENELEKCINMIDDDIDNKINNHKKNIINIDNDINNICIDIDKIKSIM